MEAAENKRKRDETNQKEGESKVTGTLYEALDFSLRETSPTNEGAKNLKSVLDDPKLAAEYVHMRELARLVEDDGHSKSFQKSKNKETAVGCLEKGLG